MTIYPVEDGEVSYQTLLLAEPYNSVGSVQDLRTGDRWFDPRARPILFSGIYDSSLSPLSIVSSGLERYCADTDWYKNPRKVLPAAINPQVLLTCIRGRTLKAPEHFNWFVIYVTCRFTTFIRCQVVTLITCQSVP